MYGKKKKYISIYCKSDCAGETKSRQRVVEESRSSDSYAKHAARGVRRHG